MKKKKTLKDIMAASNKKQQKEMIVACGCAPSLMDGTEHTLNIDEKANINVLLDVQGNTYYIKVEYLLLGSIMVVFVLCFSFSKNKKTIKK